ncbi:MAG TPA: hypothetical protein VIJ28_10315 [Chloroflexota bacterium]
MPPDSLTQPGFDPRRLLGSLVESRATVVVIGGIALVSQGIIHPTLDLDVCYEVSRENADRLVAGLRELHPRLRTEETDEGHLLARLFRFDARTMRAGQNLTLLTDAGPLDLLAHVSGLGSYADVRPWADSVLLYGMPVAILGLSGLRKAKQAAGREKDLRVLPEIDALIQLQVLDTLPPAAEEHRPESG